MKRRDTRREAARLGRLPIFFALLATLAACSRGVPLLKSAPSIDPDAKLPVESYFPLAAGSQWSYRVQDFVRKLTYQSKVRVFGKQYVKAVQREGIGVEERYSSFGPGGPYVLEEQEPMLYYRENGYLNRLLLTYQAGQVVAASATGDTQFLPEVLTQGASWDSNTQAFRVGGDIGFKVSFKHTVSLEREAVQVPAGKFDNCVRVDTFSTQGPNTAYKPGEELVFYYSDWYAPGVGLVLTRHWDDAKREQERTRIELMSYALGGADASPATSKN